LRAAPILIDADLVGSSNGNFDSRKL